MSKKQKKRTKRYSGEDAKTTGVSGQNKPVLHRYEAVQRNPLSQWLNDHRRTIRYSAIAVGVVAFVALSITGIVQLFVP